MKGGIILILILFIIWYFSYSKEPFQVERYEKIPQRDLNKHRKYKSTLLYHYGILPVNRSNNKNIPDYARFNDMDYFISNDSFEDKSVWQMVYNLFRKYNYEYIMIVPSNAFIRDKNKSIVQLLRQAGDTDMILCRNYMDHTTVNLDVIIFRNSDWALYKLHQLYHSPDISNVILDQVYVNYQHSTLKDFKEHIDHGIPYMLTNICIFNENALISNRSCFIRYHDNIDKDLKIVSMYPWITLNYAKFTTLLETPNINIKTSGKKCGKIPKLIFQTMETNLVITNVKECIQQIKQLNPEYKYYYFTSYDCRQFISKYYPHLLKYYDALLPGAYKADFWRYCILHKYGGFYLDCRMLVYSSFNSIIGKKTEFMSCVDVNQNMLYQAILGAVPNSVFMKEALDLCVDIISKKKNDVGDLGITGPKVMGMATNIVLKRTIHEDLTNVNDERITFLKWNSLRYPKYLELNNTIFACHKYTKLLTDDEVDEEIKSWIILSGKEHYSSLYNNNNIYKTTLLQ